MENNKNQSEDEIIAKLSKEHEQHKLETSKARPITLDEAQYLSQSSQPNPLKQTSK
jgi:hypothetical protein